MDEILLFPGRIRINKETFAIGPARATLKFCTIRILITNEITNFIKSYEALDLAQLNKNFNAFTQKILTKNIP
jgi:hypothetical protein